MMDKFLQFNDKTLKTNFLRKISKVSHRSSIFSRFISLGRNYAERSTGVACLFIPWDCAFSPVQFRSRNLHPPTLESSTDVPFSRCSYAGFRVVRTCMYVSPMKLDAPLSCSNDVRLILVESLTKCYWNKNLVTRNFINFKNLYDLDQTSCFKESSNIIFKLFFKIIFREVIYFLNK